MGDHRGDFDGGDVRGEACGQTPGRGEGLRPCGVALLPQRGDCSLAAGEQGADEAGAEVAVMAVGDAVDRDGFGAVAISSPPT